MNKAGIVVNQNKQGALHLLSKLKSWFQARQIAVVDTVETPAIEKWMGEVSLVICLGGDGTLLSVAGKMRSRSVPILGVNLGSLGFLTEVKQDEVFEELEKFLAGHSEIEERLMLSCMAGAVKGPAKDFVALNDIVVSREGLTRILQLHVEVNGELLAGFSGDGIIVATPTGSTAYSLSAGGAVIYPKLKAMIITPICPHTLSMRPLVVSCDDTVTVRMDVSRGNAKALLTVDGQENLEIDGSYVIRVTRSTVPVKLVKSSRRGYFETLRENFRFPR